MTYTSITPSPSNAVRMITNRDDSVDIAAFTLAVQDLTNAVEVLTLKTPTKGNIKAGSISSRVLKDKRYFAKHPLRAGDDIFFVGLFTPFFGSKANIPVSRFGRISVVADEGIPFADHNGGNTPQDLYMVETQVFGGNSGSPAFFYRHKWFRHVHVGSRASDIGDCAYLAGVIKGYFSDWSEVKVVNSVAMPVSRSNVGIAVVVPAYYAYDMLFSEQEKRIRADFGRLWYQRR